MVSKVCLFFFMVGLFVSLGGATAVGGDATGVQPVLDTYSYWRGHLTFRPIVYAEKTEDALKPEGNPRTAAPASNWKDPSFDDSRWFRICGPIFGSTQYGWGSLENGGGSKEISMVCLRGRFSVPDPAAVKSLNLSAIYRGGIVVYVNGKEIIRGHIKDGVLTADSFAKEYPFEAFVDTTKRTAIKTRLQQLKPENRRRLNLRLRRLDNVSIPLSNLKKGVNVVAIELHRSPQHPKAVKLKNRKYDWSTVGLPSVMLTASPEGSVVDNRRRPAGVQVWNEDAFADVYNLDYGSPNESLVPIHLVGVRNGSFSGQVVIGSDAPLKGVGAEMSVLTAANGAVISSDYITVQYPILNDLAGTAAKAERSGKFFRGTVSLSKVRMDTLSSSPLSEVPLCEFRMKKGYKGIKRIPGAVQPVRITVEVPDDAAPGKYAGTLVVKADGLAATKVPFIIEVIDWDLPSSMEFTTHLGIVQSVEGIALYYGVPLWSDQHWALIDRSFEFLARAGVDALYLPLVMKFHWGREGLVRWVKNDDGTFSHDFSIFDKYLEVAFKHLKNPDVACLYVWERKYRSYERQVSESAVAWRVKRMKAFKKSGPPHPLVPLLDPKTGVVTEMKAPVYSDEASVAFWKPVLDGCRERLKKYGVKDEALVLGVVPDGAPAPATIDNFYKAAPWAQWVQQSHAPGQTFKGVKVPFVKEYLIAGVYGGTKKAPDPAETRYYGWKPNTENNEIFCVFPRTGSPYRLGYETSLSLYQVFQEACLMGGHRGIARVGAEFWPLTLPDRAKGSDKKGLIISAYSVNIPSMKLSVYNFLAPGKDGALSTVRLETIYEGSQEGEARVFIEKAMEAYKGKLTIDGLDAAASEKKIQALLDNRQYVFRAYYPVLQWYPSSGWQARSRDIYSMAAKIVKFLKSQGVEKTNAKDI